MVGSCAAGSTAATCLLKSGPTVGSLDQRIRPAALNTTTFVARGSSARNSWAKQPSVSHTSSFPALGTVTVMLLNIAKLGPWNIAPVGELHNVLAKDRAPARCTGQMSMLQCSIRLVGAGCRLYEPGTGVHGTTAFADFKVQLRPTAAAAITAGRDHIAR